MAMLNCGAAILAASQAGSLHHKINLSDGSRFECAFERREAFGVRGACSRFWFHRPEPSPDKESAGQPDALQTLRAFADGLNLRGRTPVAWKITRERADERPYRRFV